MPTLFQCPNASCGRSFSTRSDSSGSNTCPHCGQVIPVDSASTVDSVRPPKDAGDTTSLGSTPKAPPPARRRVLSKDTCIGRFSIRQRLGEGAFGIVFRVHDPQLDRDVALKIAKPGRVQNEQGVERFLREARAAAQLRHPNIVPLYDAGQTDDGQHYIATAFIAGQTLESRIADSRVDDRTAAQIVRRLADALAYAHGQGIVHRDVKPANVMIDQQGEPLLMDFGLAARHEEETRLTHEGAVMGTPRYIAPEQAAGQAGEAHAAADQYSLGVVLYELLCGQAPFQGRIEAVLLAHQTQQPTRPRQHAPHLSRDLETICLKCLEKEPRQRYAACQDLADDLRRWLEGEPIRARRLSVPQRLWRWCRREPKLAAALVIAMLALITTAVVSTLGARAEARLRADADNQRRAAETERTRAQNEAVRADGEATRAIAQSEEAKKQTARAKDQARRAEITAAFMRGLFNSSDPTGASGAGLMPAGEQGRTITAVELLDRGAKLIATQLKEEPLSRASLLDTIGNVSRALGLYQQALPLLEEALAIRRQFLGAGDPDLADSMVHLASWHAEKGDIKLADKLYREALEIYRKHESPEGLAVAEVKLRIAILLSVFAHPDAEKWARESLAIRTRMLGPKHRETAVAKLVVSTCLIQGGKAIEAAKLGFDAIKDVIADGSKEKELVLNSVGNFQQAMVFREIKQHALAEGLFQKALEGLRKALGNSHPYTAIFQAELGRCYYEQQKVKEAESTWRESLDVVRNSIGIEHPKALQLVVNLAKLLESQNRAAEAMALYDELLEAQKKRLGADSRVRLKTLMSACELAAQSNQITRASALARESLTQLRAQDVPLDDHDLDTLLDMNFAIREKCEFNLVRDLHLEHINQSKRAENLTEQVDANRLMGTMYVVRRRYAEGEKYLLEALRLREGVPDYSVKAHGIALYFLAKIEWSKARFDEAGRRLEEAIDLDEKRGPTVNLRDYLQCLNALLSVRGRYADALPRVQRLLAIKDLSDSWTAGGYHDELLLRLLTNDVRGGDEVLQRMEQKFGKVIDNDITANRAFAVAMRPGKAVETELERLDAALKTHKPTMQILLARAFCLLQAGKYDDVVVACQKINVRRTNSDGMIRDLLPLMARFRKEKTNVHREALITALKDAELLLEKNRQTIDPEIGGWMPTMNLQLAWVCGQIRKELGQAKTP